MLLEFFGGKEMFDIAVAAGGEGAIVNDGFPEEFGGGEIFGQAGDSVEAIEADELGNLRVGMQAVESVFLLGERIENGVVAELFGELEIFRITGDDVDIGQHFVHAAVLDVEHVLELLIRHVFGDGMSPVAKFDEDFQCGEVVTAKVCIACRPAERILWVVYQGTPMIFRPATALSNWVV